MSRSPVDASEHGLDLTGGVGELDHLLRESDVVVLCLRVGEATRGIIGAGQLTAMKSDVVLVNVGRGPLIDETALYAALKKSRIGRAVLDVWYQHPSTGSQAGQPRIRSANLPTSCDSAHLRRDATDRRGPDRRQCRQYPVPRQ